MPYRVQELWPFSGLVTADDGGLLDIDVVTNAENVLATADFGTSTTYRTIVFTPEAVNESSGFVPAGWLVDVSDLTHEDAANGDPAAAVFPAGTYSFRALLQQSASDLGGSYLVSWLLYETDAAGDSLIRIIVAGSQSFLAATATPQDLDVSATLDEPQMIAPGNTVLLVVSIRARGVTLVGQEVELFEARSALNGGGISSLTLPAPIYYEFDRDESEAAPIPSDSAARRVDHNRSPGQAVDLTGDAERRVDYVRLPAEPVPAPLLAAVRSYTARRESVDSASTPSDEAERRVEFARPAGDATPTPVDEASRTTDVSRSTTEPVDVLAAAERLVTYGREVRYQFQPGDEPLVDPTKTMQGVVRNLDGTPYLGEAVVVLFRADLGLAVQTTTSSPTDGSYSFPRNSYDAREYFVACWAQEGSAEPLQALTERDLVPS